MAFHGIIPTELAEKLDAAKAQAVEAKNPVAVDLPGGPAMVAETGRRGGYAFVLDTGEDGETWALMAPHGEGKARWAVQVSAKAAAFVQHGDARAVYERICDRLKGWGFVLERCAASGRFDSVTRIDFAMDFIVPEDWELNPADVASKGSKTGYLEGASAHWSGRRVTGCTIGKMPGRQVVIYDKIADTVKKQKDYWWKVWGLDPKGPEKVFRVELRAGKKFLRDTWGVGSFEDVYISIGDIMADTLEKVRLISPIDSNISRCPDAPLWVKARQVIGEGLAGLFTGLAPGVVKQTVRERFSATMEKLMRGVALTYASVDVGTAHLPTILARVKTMADSVISQIEDDGDEVLKHAEKALNRYRLIEADKWKKIHNRHVPAWQSNPGNCAA